MNASCPTCGSSIPREDMPAHDCGSLPPKEDDEDEDGDEDDPDGTPLEP